jgi:hypothetical protein
VSIAAPPVAVNIVFSFRRGERRVLLLPAHERWAPQSIPSSKWTGSIFLFVFKYYTLHFKKSKKILFKCILLAFLLHFQMVFTSIVIFGEKKMD